MDKDFIYLNFQYFIIYSFLGWVVETIYCSIPAGHFVYRGFLNGPICPIYGFGALLVIHFLKSVHGDLLKLFISGMIVTSILEYITSFVLEMMFNMSWWDYTGRFMNLNGRICLWNSLMFGALSVIVMRVIHPFIMTKVSMLPQRHMEVVVPLIFIVLVSDTIITTTSIIGLNGHLEAFDKGVIEDRLNVFMRRIVNAFPDLKSNRHPKALQKVRDFMHKLR